MPTNFEEEEEEEKSGEEERKEEVGLEDEMETTDAEDAFFPTLGTQIQRNSELSHKDPHTRREARKRGR